MSIEIKGIDKLINKLNKISNIEAKKIIDDVANDVETAIISEARKFSDTEYLYIGKCETRNYGSSCYVDIGLRNDYVDFNKWKGLWYHNWGYTHWKSGKRIEPHSMWFDNAVNGAKNQALSKVKSKLKQELKEFNK